MKKTLIALAVASSAVVSGSVMASGWEQNGTGGSVDLGGTLTPVAKVTPWEVKTGDAVTGLNALVQKGQNVVSISVNKAIPVLGIRTVSKTGFQGATGGIAPQINYQGAVNIDELFLGNTTLKLDVQGEDGSKIGAMSVPYGVAGVVSWFDSVKNESQNFGSFASASGYAFFGGVAMNREGALRFSDSVEKINAIDPSVLSNFYQAEKDNLYSQQTQFEDELTYSGAYVGGIESGKTITINLDTPVTSDSEIAWKASLPVIVTYM